jgi:hypothetical protein
MSRFSRDRLSALSVTLALMMPAPGVGQVQGGLLDDFLPDAPLLPLDQILTDPDPQGWGRDVFGDPGTVPPLDRSADPAPDVSIPDVKPDSLTADSRAPATGAGSLLAEGWAWHEIGVHLPGDTFTYALRLGFPDDFWMIDFSIVDDGSDAHIAGDEGDVAFTDVDLELLREMVVAGAEPTGTMALLGVSRRSQLPQIQRDRLFSETSRSTLTLQSGTLMNGLSGTLSAGGTRVAIEAFESQMPIDENVYLLIRRYT